MAPMAMATTGKRSLRPRVLVVDDEPTLVELMDEVVAQRVDCRMICARNLEEAREVLAHQDIELLVTDVHLPDGDGMSLLAALRQRQPEASVIVITGSPSVDGAISAMRQGAADFLPKPFTVDHLTDRVQKALDRQAIIARNDRRLGRLKDAVKRLNVARRTVSKKVDILCNDLISAYGDLSRQLDVVRTQEGFRKLLGEAKDLEQLLCHGMDWVLRQLGYANIAVWLASDDQQFQLGAYVKYTVAGDESLTEAMKKGIVPAVVRDSFVHLSADEMREQLSPAELKHLEGQTLLGVNCTYLGESLATIVLFRDGNTPFTDEDAATLKAISPIFAVALASIVRGGGDGPSETQPFDEEQNPFYDGDQDAHRKGKRDKSSEADWWKRGEQPPF